MYIPDSLTSIPTSLHPFHYVNVDDLSIVNDHVIAQLGHPPHKPIASTSDILVWAHVALWHPPTSADLYKEEACVRATLTVLVNSSHSRSSQGESKVNIYARRGILYNICLARGNPKRML
jgi:hypothetical protein